MEIQLKFYFRKTQQLLFFTLSVLSHAVYGRIAVYPTAVIVVAGESVSINCTATEGSCTDSWKIGSNISTATVVYTVRYNNGTHRIPKFVAERYCVEDEVNNQAVLVMNKIDIKQAGLYHCVCNHPNETATTNIAVLDLELQFLCTGAQNGQNLILNCSMSFNGSANASFDISIKNSSGDVLRQLMNQPLSRNQSQYFLSHEIKANASMNESYFCHVTVTGATDKSTIYSKNVSSLLSCGHKSEERTDKPAAAGSMNSVGLLTGSAAATVVFLLLVIIIFIVIWKRRKEQKTIVTNLSRPHPNSKSKYVDVNKNKEDKGEKSTIYSVVGKPSNKSELTTEPLESSVFRENELTVLENDLYGERTDPSDGLKEEKAAFHQYR